MAVSIVAEISGNHGGDFDVARKLVVAAAGAGATHVKFQAYTPESMVCDRSYLVPDGPWAGRNLYDLYAECATPYHWLRELFALAEDVGITPFASVFDAEGLSYLEELDCPMYKIASFELGHLELIRAVVATGKPVVLSMGLATRQRRSRALAVAWDASHLTLLHCVSAYPANPAEVRLRSLVSGRIVLNQGDRDVYFGLSDHTRGWEVPPLAIACGAVMIEKHMRLSSAPRTPDFEFSLDEGEFQLMVSAIRRAELIMGDGGEREAPEAREEYAHDPLLRRLWVVEPIAAGERITRSNVRAYRGGDGVYAEFLDEYLDTPAWADLPVGPLRCPGHPHPAGGTADVLLFERV